VELRGSATQWERLGRGLGYEDLQLKKVKRSVMAYYLPLLQMQEDHSDLCFLQVLNLWITGDPEKYKEEVLVTALKATGFEELAEDTRRLYKGEPINSCIYILQQCNNCASQKVCCIDRKDCYSEKMSHYASQVTEIFFCSAITPNLKYSH
jgi:hypothetical protein